MKEEDCRTIEPIMEWRPIETAPISRVDDDDGPHRILVWVRSKSRPDETGAAAFGCVYQGETGNIRPQADGYLGSWDISYWMPLPEPPTGG